MSFDQITRLARDIEVDIRDITSNLKESLGGALGEERLTGIVDNVLVLSQELRKILESNRANIDATTANFREFSTQMTELVDRIDKLVAANSGNVTDGIANAKELTTKLQTTVDNMNAITGKIAQGEGTRRPARPERRDEQEPQRGPRRRQGRGRQPERRHDEGQDVEPRPRPARRVPGGPREGAGLLHRRHLAKVGSPRFYRLELSSQPFGVRRDTTTITTTTFPDGHTEVVRAGRGRVQGLDRDLGGGRLSRGALGRAGRRDRELGRRRHRLPDPQGSPPVLGRDVGLRRRRRPEPARQAVRAVLLLASVFVIGRLGRSS